MTNIMQYGSKTWTIKIAEQYRLEGFENYVVLQKILYNKLHQKCKKRR